LDNVNGTMVSETKISQMEVLTHEIFVETDIYSNMVSVLGVGQTPTLGVGQGV